jgi:putative transposase
MAIEKELLDRLLAEYDCTNPEELIGKNGLLKQLTKSILERALQAEMTVPVFWALLALLLFWGRTKPTS